MTVPYPDPAAAPLIVTATMAPADQQVFDALRAAHFPPARNFLRAHITLFHHLPPARLDELRRLASQLVQSAPPRAQVTDLFSLGGGVAYRIDSPELLVVRDRIAEWFASDLTPQDRAKPRLHITVQNKVRAEEARATLTRLAADFTPRALKISGLAVWHYRGGPWDSAFSLKFRGNGR